MEILIKCKRCRRDLKGEISGNAVIVGICTTCWEQACHEHPCCARCGKMLLNKDGEIKHQYRPCTCLPKRVIISADFDLRGTLENLVDRAASIYGEVVTVEDATQGIIDLLVATRLISSKWLTQGKD